MSITISHSVRLDVERWLRSPLVRNRTSSTVVDSIFVVRLISLLAEKLTKTSDYYRTTIISRDDSRGDDNLGLCEDGWCQCALAVPPLLLVTGVKIGVGWSRSLVGCMVEFGVGFVQDGSTSCWSLKV